MLALPFHKVYHAGTRVESFGPELDYDFGDPQMEYFGHLTRGQEAGTVWRAHINHYQVELWNSDGHLIKVVAPEREWFHAWSKSDSLAPRVQVAGISSAADPRPIVWVLVLVLREDGDVDDSAVFTGRFRGVLEALDARTHEILAVKDLTGPFLGLGDDGLLYGARRSGQGMVVELWHADLRPSTN